LWISRSKELWSSFHTEARTTLLCALGEIDYTLKVVRFSFPLNEIRDETCSLKK
jgi:hypothetical protein